MPVSNGLSVKTIIKHHLIDPFVISFYYLKMGRLWENMGQFMRTGAVNPEVFPSEREIPQIP
jgi:hypothetical protein